MNIIKEQVDRLPSWLKVLATVLLVIGIFMRLYDIYGKFFWGDEVNTLLYTAGMDTCTALNHVTSRAVIAAD